MAPGEILGRAVESAALGRATLSRRYGIDPAAPTAPAGAAQTAAGKLDRIKQLAKELESVFLSTLLGIMRESAQSTGSLLGNSAGEKIFAPFLDSERARAMVETGGFGIADSLVRQLGSRYAAEAGDASAAPAATAAPAAPAALDVMG